MMKEKVKEQFRIFIPSDLERLRLEVRGTFAEFAHDLYSYADESNPRWKVQDQNGNETTPKQHLESQEEQLRKALENAGGKKKKKRTRETYPHVRH